MTVEIQKLTKRLEELDKFISSLEHGAYKAARKVEISDIQKRILDNPPVTSDKLAQVLMWYGELATQEEMITNFEDARVQLKLKLDEMVERDNQDAGNNKV